MHGPVNDHSLPNIASPHASQQITEPPGAHFFNLMDQSKDLRLNKEPDMTNALLMQDTGALSTTKAARGNEQSDSGVQSAGPHAGSHESEAQLSESSEHQRALIRQMQQIFAARKAGVTAYDVPLNDNRVISAPELFRLMGGAGSNIRTTNATRTVSEPRGAATEILSENRSASVPPIVNLAEHAGDLTRVAPLTDGPHNQSSEGFRPMDCQDDRRQKVEERVLLEAARILGLDNVTAERIKEFLGSDTVLPVLKAWKGNSLDNPPKKAPYKCNINNLFARSFVRFHHEKRRLSPDTLKAKNRHKVSEDCVLLLVQWNANPGGMLEVQDGREDIPFLRAARLLALVADDLVNNHPNSFFGRLLEDDAISCQGFVKEEDPKMWPTEGWKDAFLKAAGPHSFRVVPLSKGICPPEDEAELKEMQQLKIAAKKSKGTGEDRKRKASSIPQRRQSPISATPNESVVVNGDRRFVTPLDPTLSSSRKQHKTPTRSRRASSRVSTSEEEAEEEDNEGGDDDFDHAEEEENQQDENKGEKEQEEADEDEEPRKKRRCLRRLVANRDLVGDSPGFEEEDIGPMRASLSEQSVYGKGKLGLTDADFTTHAIARLAKCNEEKLALQQQLEQSANRIVELESEVRETVRRLNKVNGEKKRQKDESRAIKEENQNIRTRVETLQEQLENSRRAEESLRTQLLEVEEKAKEPSEERLEDFDKRAEAEVKSKDLQDRLNAVEAEKANLQNQIVAIKQECRKVLDDWEPRERIWNGLRQICRM